MNAPTFFRHVAACLHSDQSRAQTLTGVVFQELRDRLAPATSSGIAARLPLRLKRLWMANTQPAELPQRCQLEFLGEVMQRGTLLNATEAEHAVVAVFATLQRFLGKGTEPEGIVEGLLHQLPRDLEMLWREATRDAVLGPDARPRRRDPRGAPGRGEAQKGTARVSA